MKYLIEEIKRHPNTMPRDVIKLLYQAFFGAEHILKNRERAFEWLKKEYMSVEESDGPLYENISGEICRINLGAWKKRALPVSWLFNIFINSANAENGEGDFLSRLDLVSENFDLLGASFSLSEWEEYKKEYLESGICAVHHSDKYRENEKPAYRIADRKYEKIFPVLEQIKNNRIIAIDGRAASGKTTLAKLLSEAVDAEIIHIDDFFLPFDMRSEKRLSEIGGNVHYERFASEVLSALEREESFSYRRFDCSVGDYREEINIKNKGYVIVEGSYSHHPKFEVYAGLRIFSDIDFKAQMERIVRRNGEKMAEVFREKWIPLEEKYFLGAKIKEKADIIVSNE